MTVLPKVKSNRLEYWAGVTRWVKSRKKEFLEDMKAGLFTEEEALDRLSMSSEELKEWKDLCFV